MRGNGEGELGQEEGGFHRWNAWLDIGYRAE